MAARVETGEAPRAAGAGARRGEGLREGGGVRRRAALAKGREEGSRSTAKADAAIDPTVEKKHATWPNHSSIFRLGFVLKRLYPNLYLPTKVDSSNSIFFSGKNY